jgi:hypothetical protein
VANWQTKREEFALVEPGEFFTFALPLAWSTISFQMFLNMI